jgi:hypothetical protein
MKKILKPNKTQQVFSCCVCEKSIHPESEPCCSLFIDRGVPGWKQRPTFDQEIWAHGVCLKRVIPVTEYSFPELD